jgi:FkbM family methyltransferase
MSIRLEPLMAAPKRVLHSAAVQLRTAVNRLGYDVTRENFKHRFVNALQYNGIGTVLDIGANTGQFGALLRRAGFRGRIVSVEPLGDAFAQLSRRAGSDPAWAVERAAVSDHAGAVTINVAGNSVSSSVLPMLERHAAAAPQSQYVRTEEVPATTVDELVVRHSIDPPTALLKVDVQGYEQAVLAGAARTLARFGAVRLELSLVPLYEGQALMHELVGQLAGHGFDLWLLEPGFTEPVTRRLLQLDGVFFRRS